MNNRRKLLVALGVAVVACCSALYRAAEEQFPADRFPRAIDFRRLQ